MVKHDVLSHWCHWSICSSGQPASGPAPSDPQVGNVTMINDIHHLKAVLGGWDDWKMECNISPRRLTFQKCKNQ